MKLTSTEIARMALEEGIHQGDDGGLQADRPQALENFAQRVAAAEREACAVLCETAELPLDMDVWTGTRKELSAATSRGLASLIRARGDNS